MARPLDYGDQYLSDTGDVKPNSKAASFEEIDYEVLGRPQQKQPKNLRNFQPDLQSENQELPTRDSYVGIIIKKVSSTYPYTYGVVTENGDYLECASLHNRQTNEYQPGQHVTVHRGSFQNSHYITGTGQPVRVQFFEFTAKTETTDTNVDITWEFDKTNITSDLFSIRGETLLKVKNEDTTQIVLEEGGLYQLDFELTIEATAGVDTIQHLVAKTPGGGIAAASESAGKLTPGSASCDIFEFDGTDFVDSGDNATIYNISSSAVTGSVFIQAKTETRTGLLCVDMEDCG